MLIYDYKAKFCSFEIFIICGFYCSVKLQIARQCLFSTFNSQNTYILQYYSPSSKNCLLKSETHSHKSTALKLRWFIMALLPRSAALHDWCERIVPSSSHIVEPLLSCMTTISLVRFSSKSYKSNLQTCSIKRKSILCSIYWYRKRPDKDQRKEFNFYTSR